MNEITHPITEEPSEPLYQALEEIRNIAACHQAFIFADIADTALKGGEE